MTDEAERDTLIIEDPELAAGFTQIPNWLLRSPVISRDAKLLYGILLSYAWHNDRCFPGYERLQRDMTSGSATIAKCLKELKEKGLITVHRRGQGKTSIYTIKKGMAEKFQSGTPSSSHQEEQNLPNRKREEYSIKKQSINSRKKKENEADADDSLSHIPPAARKYVKGKYGHLVQH